METKAKSRWTAIALALAGVILPGLHKFYLRQPGWGLAYIVSSGSALGLVPRAASFFEALWYFFQGQEAFDRNFNGETLPSVTRPVDTAQIGAVADALRKIDQLRQDGLISEYEFEQKRRQLLDRIG
ncbi:MULTISPECIES: SHOCT domain-containing protein [unclassified Leptolyngbya]|uniref:SHOCT domain-containing protein n=1 Tax=unclassified Leptolyngbya TaxID=2650499 RepID=UPI0016890CA2|nr:MULTISPECIES: SHOCT domain-containing protein [unclassified Leptolyngbya]MBD1910365.1 SHOCT domain-containing protein [Leptolyngbya sp. FACHB-8]MBD2155293.1 SHOCT domain-containing protein [Leptolyngbya sp. FACHB-16]